MMDTNFYLQGFFTGFLLGTTICLLGYAYLSIKQEEDLNARADVLREGMFKDFFRKDNDEWEN